MHNELFLQHLRELPLEGGRNYIQEHAPDLEDSTAVGILIADEALRLLYTPLVSLKLAELLVFFGEYIHHPSSYALGLKAKGDALEQIGHFQAAIECLDAAGEEFLSLGDEGNWARSRISWITASASLGRVEEALQQAQLAREVFQRNGELYWVCIIDHNTAWIYGEVGRYQDALKLYENALAIYPTLLDQDEIFIKRAIAIAQMSQAINLSWLGRFEEAYHLLQQAQMSFIALKDTSLAIYSEIDLVSLDYAQGYYGSVLRRYYQASDEVVQNNVDNPLMIAELKLRVANCLVKLNRSQEACRLMDEAVAVYRQLGTSLETSNALREYATTLMASGRSKEALATLEEARTLFEQGGFDRYSFITRLQQAELLLEMRLLAEAYEHANSAQEYFDARGLVTYSARANLVMAGVLIERLCQSESMQVNERAILRKDAMFLCKQLILQARRYNLLEDAYKSHYLLGRLFTIEGMALTRLANVAPIRSTNAAGAASLKTRAATVLAHLPYGSAALQGVRASHSGGTQGDASASTATQSGKLQGNYVRAAKHFEAAIAQIENILDDLAYDLSPSFLHTTWTVYEDMISLCLQQSQFERAFSYLEQARSIALRQYLIKSKSSLNSKHERDVSHSVLQASRASMLRLESELRDWQEKYHNYSNLLIDSNEFLSSTIDQEVIQAELRRCETKISELFERLHLSQAEVLAKPRTSRSRKRANSEGTASKAQPLDIERLRRHLAPDQLLLAYYLHKGRLVIFAITPKDLFVHENPTGAAQLERLLPLLHAHLQPGGWPDKLHPPQQAIRGILKKLYDLLLAPVVSLIPTRESSLIIVPFGLLHELPFHALYTGSRFLIEDFQVSYLPTSSLLLHLETPQSEQLHQVPSGQISGPLHGPEVSHRSPLVLGWSRNGQLQRVIDEAKTLAAMLNGRCYLEGEATIARLIKEAPGSPIIHLATHGQNRLDAPNFSYVQLADGQLNAIDAFSMNFEGCELVTLSGCETGLAFSGGGDEQFGLGRAFLAAGASSLLMSLWPVEDNATSQLMQLFYQALLRGEGKAQALRAAQCSLLQQNSSIYTHPYFWAGFRLVGKMSPLTQSPNEHLLSNQGRGEQVRHNAVATGGG